MKRVSKPPTFANSGMEIMNVCRICYKPGNLPIILMILEILKALITVVTGPISIEKTSSAMIPDHAEKTIMKSKTFHPSLK